MVHNFQISDSAAARIIEIIQAKSWQGKRLRINVLGGGCSGFQYQIDFDDKQNADDILFNKNSAEVIIDETSLGLLENSELDFKDTIWESGFQIKNPNATAKCGCGNSFSI